MGYGPGRGDREGMTLDANANRGAVFLSRWPPEAAAGTMEALGAALDGALCEAVAAWPDLVMDEERFVAHLAERADSSGVPAQALAALRIPDLYLTWGCGAGQPAALAGFETHLARARPSVARIDGAPAFVDEVLQVMRIRLLVGEEREGEQREPKILQYRGRGPLDGWLGVTARRLALSLKGEGNGAHVDRGVDLLEMVALSSERDPVLDQVRLRYLGDFRQVVREEVRQAIAGLSFEDRNLLRWHVVENLSLRKLATVRGTHVSSVSRDYARVRAAILAHVREALKTRTGLPTRDVESVLEGLLSRISLSIGGLLAAPDATARPSRER
jgi:RNA polymerase sigma-70 factor (ECF subfamily)